MTDAARPNPQPFDDAEYAARLDRVKGRMLTRAIDVLCDADPANIYYLTGYDALSYYTPQMMIVALDDAYPILVVRDMDVPAARVRTALPDDHIVGWADHLVDARDRHPFEQVINVLRRRGLLHQRLAVEVEAGMITPHDFHAFENGIGCRPPTTHRLIHGARAIKSPAELCYMRHASEITKRAMQAAFDALRQPDIRECDVVAEIYRAQIRGTPDYGGTYAANPPMLLTAESSATPHLGWSDRPIRAGQHLTIELSGSRHHYHSPLARTVFTGSNPPVKLRDAIGYANEGIEAVLEAVRPGMTAGEVHSVWETINSKYGLGKTSRIGYSVGCAFPPAWLERTISLRPNENIELAPGMSFHLIAGIWLAGWGVEVSETFYLDDEKAVCFATLDRGLRLIA